MDSTPAPELFDVIVIGGGVAGICVAGQLAARSRVLLLEREDAIGYHSSGRSAALYIEPYSNAAVFALTRGSREFLLEPPAGFTPVPLVAPRGALTLAPAGQEALLDAHLRLWSQRCPGLAEIPVQRARELVPILTADCARRALYDPDVFAMDTDALLQGWLRALRGHGGRVVTGAGVTALRRERGDWVLVTSAGEFRAAVVVNAAGAWAGEVGRLAGAVDVPLEPRRRSAALVAAPAEAAVVAAWPVVADIAKTFYFKPEGGALMLSPADATPSPPCDARPEEFDLALAVERAERVAQLNVRRFISTWAGLRTFAPDEVPVLGWDPRQSGFYWAAGQGGSGFQTAPAAGRWMAAELLGEPPPGDLVELGLDAAELAPARFT